jgi:8-oxo-dGTP diphosphatase
MSIPTYGDRVEGVTYKERDGVHVIISRNNDTEIVLVQAPNHAYFLPGGEIEPGEDHMECIKRELIEELGYSAVIGEYYGQADEYYYSSHRDQHYYNPIFVYETTAWEVTCEPTEKTNNIEWFPVEEAIEKLKRGSHKWGIEQWKKSHVK